jgi:hypothetical protein
MYEGQVDQGGKPHGKGVFSWYTGIPHWEEWYEGEIRNHYYHGHGTKTYADGRVESGQWENGRFQG